MDAMLDRIEQIRAHLAAFDQHVTHAPQPEQQAVLATLVEDLQTALVELQAVEEEAHDQRSAVLDIQERLQAEHRRYHDLFEFAPDGYFVTDAYGNIVEANQAAATLLNVPQHFLVGKPLLNFITLSDTNVFLAMLRRIRQSNEVLMYELQMQPRNTAPVDVSITSATMRDANSIVTAVRWIARNITPFMQAQRQLRLLETTLQQVDEPIMVTDALLDEPGPRILYANKAFTRMTGYSMDELLGKTPRILQGPLTERSELDRVRYDLTYLQRYSGECVNYRKDGSTYIVEWKVAPLRNAQGQVTHWISNQRDVTDVRRQQAAAVQRQKLESLGTLAGGVTHDFNTFLMAILANTELAQLRLPSDSSVHKQLMQIEQIVQRAAELTRQLLAYAGKGQLELKPVDLNTIVAETVELLRSTVAKTVPLHMQLGADLPTITAEPSQMQQIVLNLVSNASEAVAKTNGEIRITTGMQHADRAYFASTYLAPDLPEGQYVFLTVTDTGPGMDAATQAKIFEPFFSTKTSGRGMGLAAVLGIVRGHDGAIRVASERGRGTTFTVLLPSIQTRIKLDGAPTEQEAPQAAQEVGGS